ncbi:hypothetical protein FB446DRAFT_795613 [Lentinula raphanica]|nr:hypothetical protein FB446DRAFT_795613 [Lentinula raphanica]
MFKIELLHLTTILVQHFPSLVSHLQKDILKCAWHFVGSSNDPIVKETAFLLNARFFVVFGMRFFSRALDTVWRKNTEPALASAVASARVLQVIASEQSEQWWNSNGVVLQKLFRKGLLTEEYGLHDTLHPIFDHLAPMYPLPKEDEDPQGEMGEFHSWIHTSINDGLRNTTSLRGVLMMLNSIVQVNPERIEHFSPHLMRLLGKILKEHVSTTTIVHVMDTSSRLLVSVLDICEMSSLVEY